MQKMIYPFFLIWANYVLKVENSGDLEQINNLNVKTSENVAGFEQKWVSPSFREDCEL